MTSNIDDRHEAARAGSKTYFSGKPCKRGHLVDRYVSNGGCVNCLKPTRNLLPDDGTVFQPPPILIVDKITKEHAETLRKYIVSWAEQTLDKWGYRTFLRGGIVAEYVNTHDNPRTIAAARAAREAAGK